jgi:uncharacterized protein (TIGR00255 family)
MIHSMTAYAQGEQVHGHLTVRVTIRSYNSRHLDIALKIPSEYLPWEEAIKATVKQKVARGRVEIRLQVIDDTEAAVRYEVDQQRARAYFDALQDLNIAFDLERGITLEMFAQNRDIIKTVEVKEALEIHRPAVMACLESVVADLVQMRRNEGRHIERDLRQRLSSIQQGIDAIEVQMDGLIPYYRKRLEERIGRLTRGLVEIDPARIAQESALLADRSDIAEEIVRTKSHLNQFRNILEADAPGGRKLNFLLQELNRELNTIGSKAEKSEVAHGVVELKAEVEKIREQIQNVE